ncbi:HotDog domain-containing protein [Scenedesmus sp. NREL 46B-D3]|nr:HotDog domain-containing protein [Scenedesmus sp. NREL 46B-D3]
MAALQQKTLTGPCTARRGAFSASRPTVRPQRRAVTVRAESEAVAPAAAGAEKSMSYFKPVLDIEAIKGVLPHRYPFLLVDRVVEIEYGKFAVGYKNITVNDQFFNGHFPERAIMPGVLQIEAMAQLGGLVMLDPANKEAKEQFFFGGIESCRFRRPVVPGDTLMMRVEVTKYNKRFGIVKMNTKGYVGTDLAVEADITLAMGKAS